MNSYDVWEDVPGIPSAAAGSVRRAVAAERQGQPWPIDGDGRARAIAKAMTKLIERHAA